MSYTVKSGDTLYGLYGPNWKQLSGYTGDPNKLQVGTVLPDLPSAKTTTPTTNIGSTVSSAMGSVASAVSKSLLPVIPPNQTQPIDQSSVGGGITLDVNKLQAPIPPEVKTSNLSIIEAGNSLAQYYAYLKQQAEKADAEAEQAKKDAKAAGIPTTPEEYKTQLAVETPEEIALKEKQTKYQGLEEAQYDKLMALEPTIVSLQNQLVTLQASEQRGLEKIEEQPIVMDLIVGQQAALKRQAAIEISAVSAELGAQSAIAEMYRGNFDIANKIVTDTINLLTYDTQQRKADLQYLYQNYSDYIGTLDAKTQKALDQIKEGLDTQEKNDREDYQTKLQMITDAAGKGINLLAGMSLKDFMSKGLDEVTQLYSTKVSATAGTESSALNNLNASKGTDGFVDPNVYLTERAKSSLGATAFDAKFGYLLSPKEQQNLGLKGATAETIPLGANPSQGYTWSTVKLNGLVTPGQPFAQTAMNDFQAAIMAFAYASSGKQMSWNEARKLASVYIPNSWDLGDAVKMNKILNLEANVDQLLQTSTGESLTQAQIAKRSIQDLKSELGIAKIGTNLDLRNKVLEMGFDYDQMKADGLSDDEIKKQFGI